MLSASPMAEIGKNDHILFAFSVMYIYIYNKTVLDENIDTFRKSQVPAALYFLIQQNRCTHTFENGQNDHTVRSSGNLFNIFRWSNK